MFLHFKDDEEKEMSVANIISEQRATSRLCHGSLKEYVEAKGVSAPILMYCERYQLPSTLECHGSYGVHVWKPLNYGFSQIFVRVQAGHHDKSVMERDVYLEAKLYDGERWVQVVKHHSMLTGEEVYLPRFNDRGQRFPYPVVHAALFACAAGLTFPS